MVTIEILENKEISMDWHDDSIDIALISDGKIMEGLTFYLTKTQAETLAAVLSVMAKQLD